MPDQSTMRLCPFCAEDIKAEAKKCRWCGEWLQESPEIGQSLPPVSSDLTQDAAKNGAVAQNVAPGLPMFVITAALLAVALPIVAIGVSAIGLQYDLGIEMQRRVLATRNAKDAMASLLICWVFAPLALVIGWGVIARRLAPRIDARRAAIHSLVPLLPALLVFVFMQDGITPSAANLVGVAFSFSLVFAFPKKLRYVLVAALGGLIVNNILDFIYHSVQGMGAIGDLFLISPSFLLLTSTIAFQQIALRHYRLELQSGIWNHFVLFMKGNIFISDTR